MKDMKAYSNQPLINPGHGQLEPFTWGITTDLSTLNLSENRDDEEPPFLYLQVTPKGEIRGVTHNYYEHDDYVYVAGDLEDVDFLIAFVKDYPGLTPLLSELVLHRKFKYSQFSLQQVGLRKKDGSSFE
ncbi:hypothetical protein PS880_00811 [Pseudomonas fluorescens]|uniref:Uncharacterized protein n=2 Tax=Pseudomonas fluorescens TaxID=294 RepID=A0A5E7HCS2_PSEFL|nr:hypothetical protein PS880_00811 [Pseudomonas fluorescens]